MSNLLNGFNNGRDTTDGIGGQPSYIESLTDKQEPEPHPSISSILLDDNWHEPHREMLKTVLGTRYATYEFCTSSHPFHLHGKEFHPDPLSEERPFFSEALVHGFYSTKPDTYREGKLIPGGEQIFHSKPTGGWLRVRTVRYPDMTPLGLHPNLVVVFMNYCDGYIMHNYEGLYDAAGLKFTCSMPSGENYLATLAPSPSSSEAS